jgi:hypothetical protein
VHDDKSRVHTYLRPQTGMRRGRSEFGLVSESRIVLNVIDLSIHLLLDVLTKQLTDDFCVALAVLGLMIRLERPVLVWHCRSTLHALFW